MKNIKVIMVVAALVFLSAPNSVAADKTPAAKPAQISKETMKKVKKALTKAEMLEDMRELVESEEELLDYIPEMKAEKDASGKGFYTYDLSGRAVKLEDLDEETLAGLLIRMRQTATKLRTDRINQQMETIRRAQQLQQITRPPIAPPAQEPSRVNSPRTPPSSPPPSARR